MRPAILVCCLLLSGCITGQTSFGGFGGFGSSSNLSNARTSIAKQDWYAAFFNLSSDLESPEKATRDAANKLIADTPDFLDNVYAAVEEKARKDNRTPYHLEQTRRSIGTLRQSKLYTEDRVARLDAILKQGTIASVMSGEALFDLGDVAGIDLLQDPEIFDKLFAEAVRKAESQTSRSREQLLAFYEKADVASPYRKQVSDLVPKLQYSVADLRTGTVSRLFPDFARTRLAQMIVPMRLASDPSRRLAEEDVGARVARSLDQVTILRDGDPEKGLTVILKELEVTERAIPESTTTQVIDYYNVNIMAAILLLPRNASVLFDIRKGGASLDYGWEIVVKVDGRVVETQLVRDRVNAEYHECSNMRFQNVFGGVGAFNHYPNSQVESFCRSGGTRVSPSTLRERMLDRIAQTIITMKAISERLARQAGV